MLMKIFTNSIFCGVVVVAAAALLIMLYLDGKTDEALIGLALLVLSVVLIWLGGGSSSSGDGTPDNTQ